MKWYKPKNEIDEHDLPTEPIQYQVMEPDLPPVLYEPTQPLETLLPTSSPWNQPSPQSPPWGSVIQRPPQNIPQQQSTQAGAGKKSQLVLPPIPEEQKPTAPEKRKGERPWWEKKRPWEGEQEEERENGQPKRRQGGTRRSAYKSKRRPSAIPSLIRSFCFIAQLILAARIVLAIIQAFQSLPDNADWVRIITVLSDLLVQPLYLLMQQIQLPFIINEYVYILLAILFYGLLARMVAGILAITQGRR